MTPEIMWSILVAAGAIAIGAVLKAVESASKLQLIEKELARCATKLDSLKQQNNQSVSDIQKLHMAEKNKLTEKISELEKQIEFHKKPIPDYSKDTARGMRY